MIMDWIEVSLTVFLACWVANIFGEYFRKMTKRKIEDEEYSKAQIVPILGGVVGIVVILSFSAFILWIAC